MRVAVRWIDRSAKGKVSILHGSLSGLDARGNGRIDDKRFDFEDCSNPVLIVEIEEEVLTAGACVTVVTIDEVTSPFSFFLRDIHSDYPIFIEVYGVIVTDAEDDRSSAEIVGALSSRAGLSRLEKITSLPEQSFESAASETRDLQCVTWLGLSRDVRIFEVGFRGITFKDSQRSVWDTIRPKFHGLPVTLPELDGGPIWYDFFPGRGLGCEQGLYRSLVDGHLPILKAVHTDDDVVYDMSLFVTLEKSELQIGNIEGTHILVADAYSLGSMQTPEQQKKKDELLPGEIDRDEEPVMYISVTAINMAVVPRYSWLKLPSPGTDKPHAETGIRYKYDSSTGFASFSPDRVFLVASLNGEPVPQTEMSVLLKPGGQAEYIFKIPHRPITGERAVALASTNFLEKLDECRSFWRSKLSRGADISLPEDRIDNMIRAGVSHLDLICYGREPDGAIAATIGVYSPIGSESSPIIQFLDSMGRTDLARRAIMYFIEKQHDDGFMQNFGGYMLETGAVLWNIGEHFRYTRDVSWIASIRDSIVSACEYLISWRERNKREELLNKGYGMIDGKVADPEDPYHSYMLNGFAYLGLARAAEVFEDVDPDASARYAAEAQSLKDTIRRAVAESLGQSPVIPLGNGRWIPSMSPWAEGRGPVSLHVEDRSWFTHGTVTARDAIVGSTYLLLQEVIDPKEIFADFILGSTSELFFLRNVAFSQPYYSPHPHAHLVRDEVKPFIEEFYTNVSSIADRETYTFWEHYHHASPHKTHEEGWFLMRCRWMLYLEVENELRLLPGVPRRWLEGGKSISFSGMKSYFGTLDVKIESSVDARLINAGVRVDSEPGRLPKRLRVRIPHPLTLRATQVSSGVYDAGTESVILDDFTGAVDIELRY